MELRDQCGSDKKLAGVERIMESDRGGKEVDYKWRGEIRGSADSL